MMGCGCGYSAERRAGDESDTQYKRAQPRAAWHTPKGGRVREAWKDVL